MKDKPVEGISFSGVFVKATTTIDGGWRLTFDISLDDSEIVTQLVSMKDGLIQIACVPLSSNKRSRYDD